MTTVVVLGSPGSKAEVFAEILAMLGIPMGSGEDWRKLNATLLKDAKGDLLNPPKVGDILRAAMHMHPDIAEVVETHLQEPLWGFYDPQMVLTAIAVNSFLPDPLYVVVQRDNDDVAASLYRSGVEKGANLAPEHCLNLAGEYNRRRNEFLTMSQAPLYAVSYENLMRDGKTVDGLAALLGIRDRNKIEIARGVVLR